MIVMMIPNIIYGISNKNKPINPTNKTLEILEQIGRYGCMALMVINIPHTYLGFLFNEGHTIYLWLNIILLTSYIVIWLICWNKHEAFRAYALSIIPTAIFLLSGILLMYFPLIGFAILFGISHITISIKNI